jgi:hypothetical protein
MCRWTRIQRVTSVYRSIFSFGRQIAPPPDSTPPQLFNLDLPRTLHLYTTTCWWFLTSPTDITGLDFWIRAPNHRTPVHAGFQHPQPLKIAFSHILQVSATASLRLHARPTEIEPVGLDVQFRRLTALPSSYWAVALPPLRPVSLPKPTGSRHRILAVPRTFRRYRAYSISPAKPPHPCSHWIQPSSALRSALSRSLHVPTTVSWSSLTYPILSSRLLYY